MWRSGIQKFKLFNISQQTNQLGNAEHGNEEIQGKSIPI